jgi:hypothetical protein
MNIPLRYETPSRLLGCAEWRFLRDAPRARRAIMVMICLVLCNVILWFWSYCFPVSAVLYPRSRFCLFLSLSEGTLTVAGAEGNLILTSGDRFAFDRGWQRSWERIWSTLGSKPEFYMHEYLLPTRSGVLVWRMTDAYIWSFYIRLRDVVLTLTVAILAWVIVLARRARVA